jgi:hypothetical protein
LTLDLRPAPRCACCRFWVRYEVRPEDDAAGLGECRRHAPLPLLALQDAAAGGDHLAFWPVTEPDEWCGEWAPWPAAPKGQA